jgi:hypothetical protein
MARYRGGDGHYADVECAYAELKRYLVLNALRVGNCTQGSFPCAYIVVDNGNHGLVGFDSNDRQLRWLTGQSVPEVPVLKGSLSCFFRGRSALRM